MIRAFRHHLEGQARRWYYSTPKELRQDWLKLKTFFLATFPPQAPDMVNYKINLSNQLDYFGTAPR